MLRTAHECNTPTATDTALLTPDTLVGDHLSSVVPSPNWPTSFAPQHFTKPVESKAQVWNPPEAIVTTLEIPATSVGVETTLWFDPLPTCPSSLNPQHQTRPLPSNAHVWPVPADNMEIPEIPGTKTGDELFNIVEIPNWP